MSHSAPGWGCPDCTLLNEGSAYRCASCGRARPTGRTSDETSVLLPGRNPGPGGEGLPGHQASSPCSCRTLSYIGLALLTALMFCVKAVPAGTVGVVDLFGSVQGRALPPGLNFVNPFAAVHSVSTRVEIITAVEDVPTREGLAVHLEAAALYRLDPAMAPEMYRTVGVGALDAIVTANFHSVVREITSGHDAKALYTAGTRLQMTHDLKRELQALVADRGIIIEDTPLKKLELPRALQDSIEDKLLAEQASEKMRFILDQERQEAQRKAIQAKGIANFQQIVSGDITEGLLRWKGIEATEVIAESSNLKTVVVGGTAGMSLILPSDSRHIPVAVPPRNRSGNL